MSGIMGVVLAAGALPLEVSASPNSISATASTSSITTTASTGTVLQGFTPYAYFWIHTLGDAISANTPTTASTTFTATGMVPAEGRLATFNLQVTDAFGTVVSSNDVNVSINRT